MFAQRPDPPAINTPELDQWTKERAISFAGGTLTAAYGNLIQTFSLDAIPNNCNPSTKNVTVGPATVTRTIGGASTQRAGYSYVKKQFNKKNSSAGAAGYQVLIVTSVGEYTARLTGSMDAFATFLCDNGQALYDTIRVYSPRGADYGTFTPTSN
jgi:hypothetical protein